MKPVALAWRPPPRARRRDWPTAGGPTGRGRVARPPLRGVARHDPSLAGGPAPPGRPVLAVPVGLVGRVGGGRVPPRRLRIRLRCRAGRHPVRSERTGSFRCLPRPSSSPPTSPCRDCPPLEKASLARVRELGPDPEGQLTDEELTDEELTALALAADPDAPIAEGAVPIGIHLAQLGRALPLWYMPPAVRQGGRRWKAPFVIAVVSAFLLDRPHGALQHLRGSRAGPRRRPGQ